MKPNLKFAFVLVLLFVVSTVMYSASARAQAPKAQSAEKPIQVAVTDKGFEPASVSVRANVPAKITFVRKTDMTCATEVVVPEYKIKKALPLNKPVLVEFTPKKSGEIAFACGMDMLKGKIVVQ